MKPGKYQTERNKQRWQDLCWKVHDCAQSFVLRSHTRHGYVIIRVCCMTSSSVSGKRLWCFVHCQGQKREQRHTTKTFLEVHDHSPLIILLSAVADG